MCVCMWVFFFFEWNFIKKKEVTNDHILYMWMALYFRGGFGRGREGMQRCREKLVSLQWLQEVGSESRSEFGA